MKYYLSWMLLSVGIHGGIFWAFNSDQQSAELPLQAGQTTVSLQLISNTSNLLRSEHSTINRPTSPTNSSASANKQPKVRPITNPVSLDSEVLQTTSVNTLTQNISAQSLSNIETVRVTEHKPIEKISEPEQAIVNVTQEQPLISTTQVLNSQPEGVLTQASPQSTQKPKYPKPAIIRNQQGKVTVRLLVDRNGKVQHSELLKTSGHRLLDMSVLRFVEQEQFVPATQNGNPIDASQMFSFRFVLE